MTRQLDELLQQLQSDGSVPLRIRGVGVVLGSLAFVAVGAALMMVGHPVAAIAGVLGIVTFGFFAVVGVLRSIGGPELTISTEGIVVGGGRLIPYTWLASFSPSDRHRCVMVEPRPEHRDALLDALPAPWAALARINALGFLPTGLVALPSNLDADARTTAQLMAEASRLS